MGWISAWTKRSRVRSRGTDEPVSLVGRWFLAILLQDIVERTRYSQQIAGGQGDQVVKGADFIVVRLVFEWLVTREFSPDDDPRKINQFATRLVSSPARSELDQLQVAAVIRRTFSNRPVRYQGFDADEIVTIWGAVAFDLVKSMKLPDEEVVALVLDAEGVAWKRRVPLVPALDLDESSNSSAAGTTSS